MLNFQYTITSILLIPRSNPSLSFLFPLALFLSPIWRTSMWYLPIYFLEKNSLPSKFLSSLFPSYSNGHNLNRVKILCWLLIEKEKEEGEIWRERISLLIFNQLCLMTTTNHYYSTLFCYYAELNHWGLTFLSILPLFYTFFMTRCDAFNGCVASICGDGYDLRLWIHLGFWAMPVHARFWYFGFVFSCLV